MFTARQTRMGPVRPRSSRTPWPARRLRGIRDLKRQYRHQVRFAKHVSADGGARMKSRRSSPGRPTGADRQREYRQRKKLRSIDVSSDTPSLLKLLRAKTRLATDAVIGRALSLLSDRLAASRRAPNGKPGRGSAPARVTPNDDGLPKARASRSLPGAGRRSAPATQLELLDDVGDGDRSRRK